MEVYEANQCLVISDEIWADIAYTRHIPTLMVNDWAREHTVAVYAPPRPLIWRVSLAAITSSTTIIFGTG